MDPRLQSVCIVGAGAAGLITASILLRDGFTNVHIFTRDSSVGGTWAKERVYSGLIINNVHGEYRFSAQPMPPPSKGNRISGGDMNTYMELFYDRFLSENPSLTMHLKTEIINVRRAVIKNNKDGSEWLVKYANRDTNGSSISKFSRIILCSGGCSTPFIPDNLSIHAAKQVGFYAPIIHSSEFFENNASKITNAANGRSKGHVVVIGGGRSAQEIFLHTTWLGSIIVYLIWRAITVTSFITLGIPIDSPLRTCASSLFWGVQTNDEGTGAAGGFHAMVKAGKIQLIAPARVQSYSVETLPNIMMDSDSKPANLVVLTNGSMIQADAVVLATGYQNSWSGIFDENTMVDLGLKSFGEATGHFDDWKYSSMASPPKHKRPEPMSPIYRGIIPPNLIATRDFAINGAIFTTNPGYTFEVIAHWISSYFLGDKFLRLPSTSEEAMVHARRNLRWMLTRYPCDAGRVNESYSSGLAFWDWPQMVDGLLEDMALKSNRSGGNWCTWPFRIVSVDEIQNLGEERRQKRELSYLSL